MSNSKAFDQALNEGKVVLRAMWFNAKAKSNKITLQFAARVNRNEVDAEFFSGASQNSNPLVAMASGFDQAFNVTALASWNQAKLTEKLSLTADFVKQLLASGPDRQILFSDKDTVITASELYGQPVAIHAERTTFANPFTMQKPVSAPNGSNVVSYEGKDVYQHTELIPGDTHAFCFEGHGTRIQSFVNYLKGTAKPQATAVAKTVVEELVQVEDMF